MSKARREELEDNTIRKNLRRHIADFKIIDSLPATDAPSVLREEHAVEYDKLPFE